MRLSYINLGGVDYPACFSLSATEDIVEHFGSLDGMTAALESGNMMEQMRAVDTVLTVLLEAGQRYCEAMGKDHPAPLTCRPADIIDVTDPSAIQAIFSVIGQDSKREVEAVPPKKARPKR